MMLLCSHVWIGVTVTTVLKYSEPHSAKPTSTTLQAPQHPYPAERLLACWQVFQPAEIFNQLTQLEGAYK